MGQSKRLYGEEQEFLSVEMPISFYEQHQELFNGNIRIKSAYKKTGVSKDDKVWKSKLDALIQAKMELLEYEVEMNYKTIINK